MRNSICFARLTKASRISPSQIFIRLGKTSNSNAVQIPRSKTDNRRKEFSHRRSFTLTSTKIINWIFRCFLSCAAFIILSTPTLHLIEFAIWCICMIGFGTNLREKESIDDEKKCSLSIWPSNVRPSGLHIGQYKHIQHRRLCLKHTFHLRDISYWHIDLFREKNKS